MKRITIKEIAKKAGVSVGTVDRVLHNRGEVAEATKKLVLQVAKEGNYSTNVFARTLKLNKTHTVAVVIPQDNEYWKTLWEGVEDAAKEHDGLGFEVKLYSFDRRDQKSFLKQARKAISHSPDGVVIAPLLDEAREICEEMDDKKLPYVFVDSMLENTKPLSFVGQDTFQSGYLAARLLNYGYSGGHQCWIVKYSDFDVWNKTVKERINGFRSFYEEKNWDTTLINELVLIEDQDIDEQLSVLKQDADLHIFVPNSRAFQVISLLGEKPQMTIGRMIGYDQTKKNVAALLDGNIDFIINQNPARQGFLSIQCLFKHLIVKGEVASLHFMPVEVVTKENYKYSNTNFRL